MQEQQKHAEPARRALLAEPSADFKFTASERTCLQHDHCPACGAPMIPGPSGGISRNYYCTDRQLCRLGFNMTKRGDTLLFAQPIGEVDDDRYNRYRKK